MGITPGIGINVPQDVLTSGYGEQLKTFARTAEARGFESLWVSESLRPAVADPLGVLHFLAAATQHARLGAAVLLTPLRSPLRLAREMATLDQLSNGRAIVGVGLGNDPNDYSRHGLAQPAHRGAHFEEGVRLLLELLTQDEVTCTEWWRLESEPAPLRTVQTPRPPVWFGARRPAALERAVRLGDGWVAAGSMTWDEFAKALAHVRELLESRDRDGATFTIAKRMYLHVAEGPAPVEELNRWFVHHYGNARRMQDMFLIGNAQKCVDWLNELKHLGVDNLILHPVVDVFEQLELLARDVLPNIG